MILPNVQTCGHIYKRETNVDCWKVEWTWSRMTHMMWTIDVYRWRKFLEVVPVSIGGKLFSPIVKQFIAENCVLATIGGLRQVSSRNGCLQEFDSRPVEKPCPAEIAN